MGKTKKYKFASTFFNDLEENFNLKPSDAKIIRGYHFGAIDIEREKFGKYSKKLDRIGLDLLGDSMG